MRSRQAIRKETFLQLGALPPNPRGLTLWGQNDWHTMNALERRVGQRRGATRAPTQAPEWRGGLRPPPRKKTPRSKTYHRPKMVLTMGSTLDIVLFLFQILCGISGSSLYGFVSRVRFDDSDSNLIACA